MLSLLRLPNIEDDTYDFYDCYDQEYINIDTNDILSTEPQPNNATNTNILDLHDNFIHSTTGCDALITLLLQRNITLPPSFQQSLDNKKIEEEKKREMQNKENEIDSLDVPYPPPPPPEDDDDEVEKKLYTTQGEWNDEWDDEFMERQVREQAKARAEAHAKREQYLNLSDKEYDQTRKEKLEEQQKQKVEKLEQKERREFTKVSRPSTGEYIVESMSWDEDKMLLQMDMISNRREDALTKKRNMPGASGNITSGMGYVYQQDRSDIYSNNKRNVEKISFDTDSDDPSSDIDSENTFDARTHVQNRGKFDKRDSHTRRKSSSQYQISSRGTTTQTSATTTTTRTGATSIKETIAYEVEADDDWFIEQERIAAEIVKRREKEFYQKQMGRSSLSESDKNIKSADGTDDGNDSDIPPPPPDEDDDDQEVDEQDKNQDNMTDKLSKFALPTTMMPYVTETTAPVPKISSTNTTITSGGYNSNIFPNMRNNSTITTTKSTSNMNNDTTLAKNESETITPNPGPVKLSFKKKIIQIQSLKSISTTVPPTMTVVNENSSRTNMLGISNMSSMSSNNSFSSTTSTAPFRSALTTQIRESGILQIRDIHNRQGNGNVNGLSIVSNTLSTAQGQVTPLLSPRIRYSVQQPQPPPLPLNDPPSLPLPLGYCINTNNTAAIDQISGNYSNAVTSGSTSGSTSASTYRAHVPNADAPPQLVKVYLYISPRDCELHNITLPVPNTYINVTCFPTMTGQGIKELFLSIHEDTRPEIDLPNINDSNYYCLRMLEDYDFEPDEGPYPDTDMDLDESTYFLSWSLKKVVVMYDATSQNPNMQKILAQKAAQESQMAAAAAAAAATSAVGYDEDAFDSNNNVYRRESNYPIERKHQQGEGHRSGLALDSLDIDTNPNEHDFYAAMYNENGRFDRYNHNNNNNNNNEGNRPLVIDSDEETPGSMSILTLDTNSATISSTKVNNYDTVGYYGGNDTTSTTITASTPITVPASTCYSSSMSTYSSSSYNSSMPGSSATHSSFMVKAASNTQHSINSITSTSSGSNSVGGINSYFQRPSRFMNGSVQMQHLRQTMCIKTMLEDGSESYTMTFTPFMTLSDTLRFINRKITLHRASSKFHDPYSNEDNEYNETNSVFIYAYTSNQIPIPEALITIPIETSISSLIYENTEIPVIRLVRKVLQGCENPWLTYIEDQLDAHMNNLPPVQLPYTTTEDIRNNTLINNDGRRIGLDSLSTISARGVNIMKIVTVQAMDLYVSSVLSTLTQDQAVRYTEYKVIKVNARGKRQDRYMGVDGINLYNDTTSMLHEHGNVDKTGGLEFLMNALNGTANTTAIGGNNGGNSNLGGANATASGNTINNCIGHNNHTNAMSMTQNTTNYCESGYGCNDISSHDDINNGFTTISMSTSTSTSSMTSHQPTRKLTSLFNDSMFSKSVYKKKRPLTTITSVSFDKMKLSTVVLTFRVPGSPDETRVYELERPLECGFVVAKLKFLLSL